MLNLNDFIFFPPGQIDIGINYSDVEKIFQKTRDTSIKKEYIEASTPAKTISYTQFFIQRKLVNIKSFMIFTNDTKYITEAEREGWGWIWKNKWIKKENVSWKNPFLDENDFYYNDYSDILPVMHISWNDALEYTRWLSKVNNENIRLPYEYEWEVLSYFAGVNSIINENIFKIDENILIHNFILQLKDEIENSEFQLGLLWEWTNDWYSGYDDSIKNKDFGEIYKTLRGGSLLSDKIQRTREFRFRRCPTARSPYYGFRIVIDKKFQI